MSTAPAPQPSAASPVTIRYHGLFLVILAGLGMVGPFSIDTMFPAFVRMEAEWGVSELALQQVVSTYLFAFAVMSLIHGPLSDALGRKPVILAGGLLYVAASVGCALAPDLSVLLVFRAVQGLSAGAGVIISRAMVRDVFADSQAQRTMSHIAMIFGLAPAVAPIAGGLLLGITGWRGIFWALAGMGGLLALLVWLGLPETHPRASRTPLHLGNIARGLVEVLRDPAGRRLSLTAALNNGAMFLYISAAPLLVVNLLGLGENDFWILFVPLISGIVIGSWVSGRLAGRMSGFRMASLGYRISIAACTINLLLNLFPATSGLPWTVLPLPVFTFGIALAFPILTLAMLDLFPNSRGSASSVQNFVALLGNSVISAVVAPLLGGSLIWLAAGSLVLLTGGLGAVAPPPGTATGPRAAN